MKTTIPQSLVAIAAVFTMLIVPTAITASSSDVSSESTTYFESKRSKLTGLKAHSITRDDLPGVDQSEVKNTHSIYGIVKEKHDDDLIPTEPRPIDELSSATDNG